MNPLIKYLIFALLNFFVFFGALFLILRKPLGSFLLKRREDYVSESKKWSDAFDCAVAASKEIKDKLATIDKDGSAFLEMTKKDISSNGALMLKKAEEAAKIIHTDTERMAKAEHFSYGSRLKEDFVSSLIREAQEDLSGSVDDNMAKGYILESSYKARSGDVVGS